MLASDTVVSLARKPRDAQAAHRVAPFPQWFLGVTIADGDAMGSAWITPRTKRSAPDAADANSGAAVPTIITKLLPVAVATFDRIAKPIMPNRRAHSEATLFSFYARTLSAARRGTRPPTCRVSCSRQGSGLATSLSRAATSRARTCARSGRRSAAVAARGLACATRRAARLPRSPGGSVLRMPRAAVLSRHVPRAHGPARAMPCPARTPARVLPERC